MKGSIYYSSYSFWSDRQTRQFIQGVAVTKETEDSILTAVIMIDNNQGYNIFAC